jgi:hypothetical protein
MPEPTRTEIKDKTGELVKAAAPGRFDPPEQQQVVQMLLSNQNALLDAWSKKCRRSGSGAGGAKTLKDVIEETESLYMVKRAEAEIDIFNNGQYTTFPANGKEINNVVYPGGNTAMRSYNGGQIDGKTVDLLVLVPDEHPLLKPVMDEINTLRHVEVDIDAFNDLPESERIARIAQQEEALREIRELNQTPNYQGDDKQRRIQELAKNLLPSRWVYTRGHIAYTK